MDEWCLVWLGTDEQAAWKAWEERREEADKYRGPNYPIYLVEYCVGDDDVDRRLTKRQFDELNSTDDPEVIEEYRDYGHELDSYEADYNY